MQMQKLLQILIYFFYLIKHLIKYNKRTEPYLQKMGLGDGMQSKIRIFYNVHINLYCSLKESFGIVVKLKHEIVNNTM